MTASCFPKKNLKDQYLLAIFNLRYGTIFEGIFSTFNSLRENIISVENFTTFRRKSQVCDHLNESYGAVLSCVVCFSVLCKLKFPGFSILARFKNF